MENPIQSVALNSVLPISQTSEVMREVIVGTLLILSSRIVFEWQRVIQNWKRLLLFNPPSSSHVLFKGTIPSYFYGAKLVGEEISFRSNSPAKIFCNPHEFECHQANWNMRKTGFNAGAVFLNNNKKAPKI